MSDHDPEAEGRAALHAGRPENSNPHPEFTESAEAWNYGWNAAAAERGARRIATEAPKG